MSRKIIKDEADEIFTQSERKCVENTLVLTGGGTLQTFFSMGAVACLVDNGLFNFDLITSVSGGSMLLTFIDLCMNPSYNYINKRNWYNRYVRKNIYKLASSKLIPFAIINNLDIRKFEKYVFDTIPDFKGTLTEDNNRVICEYNYIDANTKTTSCDTSDIIDLSNNIKEDYWYIIRTARCCLPFTNINNKPTYDAGNISNIPVSTLLTRYKSKRLIIVKVYSRLDYDNYPPMHMSDLLKNWLFSNMDASENTLNDMIDLSTPENKKNIFCTMSNGLNKSKDKFHRELFTDIQLETDLLLRMYNGLLYTNIDMAKVIENEGYIQMYHKLKSTGEATVFKIPNPDVYNENVKTIYENWKTQNVVFELMKDILEMGIKNI